VLSIQTPGDIGPLAADCRRSAVYELEGELEGLLHVDLDKEGLAEYRAQLGLLQPSSASFASSSAASSASSALVQQIFRQLDADGSGALSLHEAASIFVRINSRLGRRYGEGDVRRFFAALELSADGSIDLGEFRRAFDSLV